MMCYNEFISNYELLYSREIWSVMNKRYSSIILDYLRLNRYCEILSLTNRFLELLCVFYQYGIYDDITSDICVAYIVYNTGNMYDILKSMKRDILYDDHIYKVPEMKRVFDSLYIRSERVC